MRSDILFTRKSVHIKLTKELHAALRTKLFKYGITMQDLFHEAAELALDEGSRSEKFLEKISKKKLLLTLQKIDRDEKSRLGELDSETMYNLLEDSGENEKSSSE